MDSNLEAPKKVNIGKGMWLLLFFITGFVDSVQILIAVTVPGIGWIANIIFNVIFGFPLSLYLHFNGVSMFKGKALLKLISTFAIDQGTAGLAPAWTIALIYTYKSVGAKNNPEKLASKAFNILDKGVDILTSKKLPLNKSGLRLPSTRGIPLNQSGVRIPQARPPVIVPPRNVDVKSDFSKN